MRTRVSTAIDATPRESVDCSTPALPRHITLINADDSCDKTATELILDDFAEAFEVYARHDIGVDAHIPEITRFALNRLDVADPHELAQFDTIVLGYTLSDDNTLTGTTSPLPTLLAKGNLKAGTRLYAIASTDDYEPARVVSSFVLLEDFCSEHQLDWRGGLAVGASDMVLIAAKMPRMGMVRRHLSEATDELILAVRCGARAGTIVVPAPIPRFIYRFIVNKQQR